MNIYYSVSLFHIFILLLQSRKELSCNEQEADLLTDLLCCPAVTLSGC